MDKPKPTIVPPGAGERIAVVGDIYTFLSTGADTDGKFALMHGVIFPNAGPPPHTHTREDEAFYILKGTVAIYDDGERTEVGPGAWIRLPRGTRHWFRNESEQPVEMLIHVAPAGMEDFFRGVGTPWESDERPPLPSEQEIQLLTETAPKFGMHIG